MKHIFDCMGCPDCGTTMSSSYEKEMFNFQIEEGNTKRVEFTSPIWECPSCGCIVADPAAEECEDKAVREAFDLMSHQKTTNIINALGLDEVAQLLEIPVKGVDRVRRDVAIFNKTQNDLLLKHYEEKKNG